METPEEQVLEKQTQEFSWRVKNYARDHRMNVRQLHAIWDAGVAKTEAEDAIEGFCWQVHNYARDHSLAADHLKAIFDAGIVACAQTSNEPEVKELV